MSIFRRRTARRSSPSSPLDAFIGGIVHKPGFSGVCRVTVVGYQQFRDALSVRLRDAGMTDLDLSALLAGRLVGVCPRCEMRHSAEYLEWLAAVEPAFAGPKAPHVSRFHQGKCVNEECPSTDLLLYYA